MDTNRKEGTKREVKGAVKEVVGKFTGNKSKQVAGNVEKNLGKIQNEAGKASDAVRDAARKDN
ncbi:MAG TPA: CsbD family protein [Xanthomonadaceae bacterium]|nr:CsbD family protein [Xanthomonadaceae bacterium]